MKKVLFVATVSGHIKNFHEPYLKLFKDKGYLVYVAAKNTLIEGTKIEYCDYFIDLDISRSPYSLNNIKAIKKLKRIIDKEQFDIIHCHTPMGSVVARLAAKNSRKKFGTRVIYTAHGFHFYKGAPIKNWLLFYPIEWYLAKYTDTIITINMEDFNLSKNKFSKRCKNFEYIPGIGVNPAKFDFSIDDNEKTIIRKKLGISKDDFVIIYPARLCRDKNQLLLIEFMQNIKDKNIVLLLPGSDEMNGFHKSIIEQKKLHNVILLGNRDDIPCLLKISDLLISTSVREGFGLNLVEALYCELPVIAVNNRGHREIVIDGKNGFLIENNLNELIQSFNKLYNNKELYNMIKANCKASAKKFLLDNSLRITEKIYKLSK